MLEGAKQEGTSDVAYSQNQLLFEDDHAAQRPTTAQYSAPGKYQGNVSETLLEPKENSRIPKSPVGDSRPPLQAVNTVNNC